MRDEELRAALLAASEADWAALPGPEEVPAFSPRYQRWEQRFRRDPRRGGRTAWGPVARRAACFLLAALLTGALVLECSPAARAWVRQWFVVEQETGDSYRFRETLPIGGMDRWTLGALPDGYAGEPIGDLMLFSGIAYRGPGPEIDFFYQRMSEGGGWYVDRSGRTAESVAVGTRPGRLYRGEDGQPNVLVWFDEGTKYTFCLWSMLSADELLSLAESVEKEEIP